MAHNKRVITHEDLARRKQKLAEIKLENEKANQIKLTKKAKFFKTPLGKSIWFFSLIVSIFCVVFIVDGMLSKSYTKFEVKGNFQDKVYLVKGGYLTASTFYWVYFNDDQNFGIHVHKSQFKEINKLGYVELGRSPIFKVPSDFRLKNIIGQYESHTLLRSFNYLVLGPVFLLILSILWLFSKPHKSFQWIMYGYFVMVTLPLVFLVLVIKVISFMNGIGLYEINVAELNI